MSPYKPVFQSISEDTKIENVVGKRSVITFQRFGFAVKDFQFLLFIHEMEQLSFRKFKNLVSTLHVTNDLGERSITILEGYQYLRVLTKNSEQRQMILHCVEKSRRNRPDFKKATLADSS